MSNIEISVPSTQVEKNRLFNKIIYKNNGNTYELNQAVISNNSGSFIWNKEASFNLIANIPGATNPWGSEVCGFYGEEVYYSEGPALSIGERNITLNVPKISSDSPDYGYYRWNYNWEGSSISSGTTITDPNTPITLKLNGSEDARYYKVVVDCDDGLCINGDDTQTYVEANNVSARATIALTTNEPSFGLVDNNQFLFAGTVGRQTDSNTKPNAQGFSDWYWGGSKEGSTMLGDLQSSSDTLRATARNKVVWTAKLSTAVVLGTNYSKGAYTTTYNFSDYSDLANVTLDTSKPIYVQMGLSSTLYNGFFYATSSGSGLDSSVVSSYNNANNGNIRITSFTSNSITVYHYHTATLSTYRKVVLFKIYQR